MRYFGIACPAQRPCEVLRGLCPRRQLRSVLPRSRWYKPRHVPNHVLRAATCCRGSLFSCLVVEGFCSHSATMCDCFSWTALSTAATVMFFRRERSQCIHCRHQLCVGFLLVCTACLIDVLPWSDGRQKRTSPYGRFRQASTPAIASTPWTDQLLVMHQSSSAIGRCLLSGRRLPCA